MKRLTLSLAQAENGEETLPSWVGCGGGRIRHAPDGRCSTFCRIETQSLSVVWNDLHLPFTVPVVADWPVLYRHA
jgi:hypothetical protein